MLRMELMSFAHGSKQASLWKLMSKLVEVKREVKMEVIPAKA